MAGLIQKISPFMIVLSCILVSAYAESHGIATFYTPPYTPSACYGNHHEGHMIAAVSEHLWKNGAACGTRYRATCVDGPCRGSRTVTVKIVDLCPSPGCRGTIDLSQEAFASIADPNAGVINISFQQL